MRFKNLFVFVLGCIFASAVWYVATLSSYGVVKEVTKTAIEQPTTETNHTTEIEVKNKKGEINISDVDTSETERKKRFRLFR